MHHIDNATSSDVEGPKEPVGCGFSRRSTGLNWPRPPPARLGSSNRSCDSDSTCSVSSSSALTPSISPSNANEVPQEMAFFSRGEGVKSERSSSAASLVPAPQRQHVPVGSQDPPRTSGCHHVRMPSTSSIPMGNANQYYDNNVYYHSSPTFASQHGSTPATPYFNIRYGNIEIGGENVTINSRNVSGTPTSVNTNNVFAQAFDSGFYSYIYSDETGVHIRASHSQGLTITNGGHGNRGSVIRISGPAPQ